MILNILTMYHGIISQDMEVFNESHFLLSKILTFDFGAVVAQ